MGGGDNKIAANGTARTGDKHRDMYLKWKDTFTEKDI